MRHLWSFLAGIVAAPVAWVLVTLGQDGSDRTVTRWVEVGTFTTANLIEPTVYLAVAGIVLGLLGTLRVSPLGPLVAGLLLAAPYVGLLIDPFALRDRLPDNWSLLGDRLPFFEPVQNGTLFLLGVLLVMATFSGKRWRRWPAPAVAVPAAAGTAPNGDGAEKKDDDEPTPTDWSALTADLSDRDTPPPTLGYPMADTPPTPLPRREESPWSAPPRTASQRDTPTE
ncbi:hypothetical protein AB0J86_20535 [Micromonospora sp. NPDC049559]|uniref:hypothetical protein n=1 Tax=Micromonospora sp. NPDC049559 TaxID=3155923 RepID=UPI00343476FB